MTSRQTIPPGRFEEEVQTLQPPKNVIIINNSISNMKRVSCKRLTSVQICLLDTSSLLNIFYVYTPTFCVVKKKLHLDKIYSIIINKNIRIKNNKNQESLSGN